MQVATNAHPSPWRYRGYRLLSFLSLPIASSVSIRRIDPNSSNLSIPFSFSLSRTFERPFEEGTTRVVTGWPRRPRVEEKSDRDAQFRIGPPLPSPDRGVSDEWVNEHHPSDWSKRKRLRAVRNVTITKWFCYWILHRYYVWCDRKMII